jgi:recombination protein RecT
MTTEIAKKSDVRSLIESDAFKAQIQKALPKHLTPDRFIRVAVTALTRTPKLAECTQASLFNSLLTCSQLGIEPDGRRAHLIPYGKDCQLIIDYKGLAELAMRSGAVSNLHADVVCDADVFVYDRGAVTDHKIDFRKPRGKVYAVYAICRFKDGSEKAEVMSADEVESIRKRSKAGQSGPWVTDWNEMAKKTAFRRLSKWLPLSPEYRDALDHDADAIDITGSIKTEPKPMREAVEITLDDLDMGDAKGGEDASK